MEQPMRDVASDILTWPWFPNPTATTSTAIWFAIPAATSVSTPSSQPSQSILFGREARGDPSGRSARQALDVLVAERLEQQHCGERFLSHVA